MTVLSSLRAVATGADAAVVDDIKRASASAHVDFGYLLAEARQESSFQPNAKAATTGASGLYQFIDSTWLRAVKQWGGKYGLGAEANAITVQSNGNASVADPTTRQRILALRENPSLSASLAAELAAENKQALESDLGRPATPTALYLAHFLGAHGATNFLRTIETDGSANAASLLPQAAAANHSVFYDEADHARSVSQIYENFAARIEGQATSYAQSTGVSPEVGAEAAALNPLSLPKETSQALLENMNLLALAALKLLGRERDPAAKRAEDSKITPDGRQLLDQQA